MAIAAAAPRRPARLRARPSAIWAGDRQGPRPRDRRAAFRRIRRLGRGAADRAQALPAGRDAAGPKAAPLGGLRLSGAAAHLAAGAGLSAPVAGLRPGLLAGPLCGDG